MRNTLVAVAGCDSIADTEALGGANFTNTSYLTYLRNKFPISYSSATA